MIDDLNLEAEWLGTPSLNSRQRRQIEGMGVSREAVHRAGGLGCAARVEMGLQAELDRVALH